MNQDIQTRVAELVQEHGLETDVASPLLDLVSEIGEVAKEVLKATGYGKSAFIPTAEWEQELGDALFALICVANTTGIDLDKALSGVLEKYRVRLQKKQDAGSGS